VKAKSSIVIAVLGITVLVLLAGCTAINSPPVVSFTCNPPSGGAPLSVSFNASGSYDSDGTIVGYQWTFGDGSSGTGVQISHTYQGPGSFVAKLTVTDNQGARGTSSKTITVSVGLAPPAWIIGTWSDEFDINTFTFTSNDVVFTTTAGSISFSQVYIAAIADMSDSATSTSYTVTITISDGGTTTTSVYQFVKLTPSSLNYSISVGGVTAGPIPLYLQ